MRKPSLRYIDVASRAGTKLSIFAGDNGLCYTSRAERFQHFNEKKSSLPWLRLVPVLLSPNLLGAMNVLSADRRTTERQRVSRLLSAREELLYRAHFFECCFCMKRVRRVSERSLSEWLFSPDTLLPFDWTLRNSPAVYVLIFETLQATAEFTRLRNLNNAPSHAWFFFLKLNVSVVTFRVSNAIFIIWCNSYWEELILEITSKWE